MTVPKLARTVWLIAALAAIGMAGLNLLADWLKHIMGM